MTVHSATTLLPSVDVAYTLHRPTPTASTSPSSYTFATVGSEDVHSSFLTEASAGSTVDTRWNTSPT